MSVFGWLLEKPGPGKMKRKDYDKALKKLLPKAEGAAKKGKLQDAAWLYQRASILGRRAGEWDDAIENALKAAGYSEGEKRMFSAGWSYRSAALAARGKGNHELTIGYALKGADRFSETGSVYAAKWCYETAAQAAKASGRENDAIKFLKKAKTIEHDDETEVEIQRLKNIVCHPRVDQYADKEEVTEGEPVTFEAVVENHGKEPLKNIMVGDMDARISHEIERLGPGDVKIFSYRTWGRVGVLESPYTFITWENAKGDVLDSELNPVSVRVRPRIQISPHVYPEPAVAGKACKLVVMIKNLSSTTIHDVEVDLDFGEDVDAPHPEKKGLGKIEPGDEEGAGWSMRIAVPGRHRIASGSVRMTGDDGTEFVQEVWDIMAAVAQAETPPKRPYESEEEFAKDKRAVDDSITAYPIAESVYRDMEKAMWHQQRGYTLRGIGLDALERHVRDNCSDMSPVAEGESGGGKALMYSFRMDGAHHLLTVVMKKDEDFVHLVLRLYSERMQGLAGELQAIAGIIRHTLISGEGAKEVEKVEIKKVINIIDSVVQRSGIGSGGEEGEVTEKKTTVKDSVVQRTDS